MTRFVGHRTAAGFACVLLFAATSARADSPADPQNAQNTVQSSQGPLVLEHSTDGLVFAPEAGVTKVDGTSRTLVGGYGGWLIDNSLLLGGAAYWVSGHDQATARDRDMSYGGFVAGWAVPLGSAVRFGVRGLVGFGNGSLLDNVTFYAPCSASGAQACPPVPVCAPQHSCSAATATVNATVRREYDFFVAEPRAEVAVRLSKWMALTAEASYRAVAAGNSDADRRLRGAVGTVGLRFGPFR